MIDVARLRELAAAATPGPWRWGGNTQNRELYLSTVHHGRRFVMQFVSWGDGLEREHGQPRFRTEPGEAGYMVDASGLIRYEVLGDRTMRDAGENPYRHDISGIANHDANYIAAASPDVLLALLDERDDLVALLREWLTYTHLRERAFDPDLDPDDEYASGRSLITRTDASIDADLDEWDDPYMARGHKRKGVRCPSHYHRNQCMRTTDHDSPHRWTSSTDGRSLVWTNAQARCATCNGLLGIGCNHEPRPDCPRTQFLTPAITDITPTEAATWTHDTPPGWTPEQAEAEATDTRLRDIIWTALHAGEVDEIVGQQILDRWDNTRPTAPDTDRQPVSPIDRAKQHEGARVLVNLSLHTVHDLLRGREARYADGLVVRMTYSPPFGLQDDPVGSGS